MTPSQPNPDPAEQPRAPSPEEAGVRGNGGALDLLLDMELPLTVRFGSARMPLSEILKLTAGSLIDLDRASENAVELLVNGKAIARGAAVTVRGNYGIRITEVAAVREGGSSGPVLGAAAVRNGGESS
jgi:flagellar motor switch protein FliN/FliY